MGYDRVATQYDEQIGSELDGKPLDRALLGALVETAAGAPILDVGAGPGHVARHLSALGARVIVTDLSLAMCARAVPLPVVAADMTALPFASNSVAAIVSFYATIHLDDDDRAWAYSEFTRVLRPGGHALIAFHTRDAQVESGGELAVSTFLGHEVDLVFRFLDPMVEASAMMDAGLTITAQLQRLPYAGYEHPSERGYLLVRKP